LKNILVSGNSGSEFAEKALNFQGRKGEPFIFRLPEKDP